LLVVHVSAVILVIEDDADIRESLQQVLELEGYSVRTASNGREGLEALHADGRPALILLDLMMPVMNGWEFLEAQRGAGELSSVPVVIVSAAHDLTRATSAVATIKKPVDLDVLLEVIARYTHTAQAHV
jgi:CheY-like chemotaxis protein